VNGVRRRLGALRSDADTRSLSLDTAWSLGIEAFRIVSAVATFTMLGRSLGPGAYGDYVAIYAVLGMFTALAYAALMLVVLQVSMRDGESPATVGRSCLTIALVSGAVFMAAAVVAVAFVVDTVSVRTALAFALSEMIFTGAAEVITNAYVAATTFRSGVRIRLANMVARLAVVGTLSGTGSLTLGNLAVGNLLVLAAFSVGVLAFVHRRTGMLLLPGRPEWRFVRMGGLFVGPMIAYNLLNDGDKIVLRSRVDEATVGLYSAAYRIVGLALVPLGALVGSSHLRFLQHDENATGQHVRRARRFTVVGLVYALPVGVGLMAFAPLITTLLGDSFAGTEAMIRWLVPFVLVRSCWTFAMNGLLGLGRLGVRALIQALSAVSSMALYLVCIPRWGWQGAVVATVLNELLLSIAAWVALLRAQARHDAGVSVQTAEASHEPDAAPVTGA
jgi:O-antigen/teichoic acid export membrane protein